MQASSSLIPIAATNAQPSRLVSNQPLLWVCFPIVALTIAMIGIAIFETSEERRFQARVQQMRDEGTPVDQASLVDWTRARTRSEGVVAWSEINVMHRMLSQMRLKSPSKMGIPLDADHVLYNALFLGKEVPDDQRISDYLEKLRPLVRAVENAVELPNPVTIFDQIDSAVALGFDGVQSELRLELMHALNHRQAERATNAIDLLFRVADVFKSDNESQEFVGNDSYWKKRNEYVAITRSLCADLWDEATLLTLMERLQSKSKHDDRGHSMVIRNRALGLDEIPRVVEEHESLVRRSDGALTGFRFIPVPRKLLSEMA